MQTGSTVRGSATGRATRRVLPVLLLLVFAAGFAALGIWQVQRLTLRAAPVPPEALPRGDLAALTYHRVVVNGVFDPRGVVLATATSPLGNGYWVMVPVTRGTNPRLTQIAGAAPRVTGTMTQ
jgi:surfeit locus 1 family protein